MSGGFLEGSLKRGKWQWISLVFTGSAFLLLHWKGVEVVQAWLWNLLFIAILLQNGWFLFQLHSYERKIRELRQQSEQDALTGLKNRMAFAAAAHAVEVKGEGATVVVCDIDGLKWINDSMGHQVGDEIIRQAAIALVACCPKQAQIYRMGGDEFIALLPAKLSMAECEQLKACLEEYTSQKEYLRLSVGMACLEKQESLKETIRLADCAMYQHRKERYKNQGLSVGVDKERRSLAHNVEFDIV
jgi:diguanylate cyclase (GGDEF)-like protein